MQLLGFFEIQPMEIHNELHSVYGEKNHCYTAVKKWYQLFHERSTNAHIQQ